MELHDGRRCAFVPHRRQGNRLVGSDDGNVYALDATTGAKVWNYTTFGPAWSSPTVANGRLRDEHAFRSER